MYKINDYLIYGKDVCQVKDIEIKKYNNQDYYLLVPIKDSTLKLEVPVEDKQNKIRDLIKKEDLKRLIEKIPDIETIDVDEKFLESEYKRLLSTGNEEDLVKVIKTTYLRNKERIENKKRRAEIDSIYFKEAETALYAEVCALLNMSLQEAKEYVISKVEALTN